MTLGDPCDVIDDTASDMAAIDLCEVGLGVSPTVAAGEIYDGYDYAFVVSGVGRAVVAASCLAFGLYTSADDIAVVVGCSVWVATDCREDS